MTDPGLHPGEAPGLGSFGTGVRAAVIGASGGIGAALVELLAGDPGVAEVLAFSRSGRAIDRPKVTAGIIDIADPDSIAAATADLGDVHLVIVATGLLHADGLSPERDLRQLDAASFARAFAVNATGPALVAQALLPRLAKGRKTAFAALSARVGSIGDNRLGGWHAYRASKTALNQLLRTMAIEQARKNPASLVVGLHPGTVDTGLSKPFQRNVPRLFTPAESAGHLLAVLDRLTPADSGRVFAWDGAAIAW